MKTTSSALRSWLLAGLGLLVLAGAGCEKPDQIRSYTVPKPEQVYAENHVEPSEDKDEVPAPSAEMVPTRMIGAIVPEGESLWFFKTTGSPDAVGKAMEPFRKLLDSLRFENGEPDWTLPEGWTRKPGNRFRYATLGYEIDGTPLEMSVTRLGKPEGDLDDAVLINVNRWRGQVGLPDVSPDDLYSDEVRKLTVDDRPVVLVNILGQAPKGGSGMRPPFAGGPGATSPPPRQAPMPDFTQLELPEGWSRAENDQFSVFAAEIKESGQEARFTITTLGPAALRLLERNLNRWRGQVGLPPLQGKQLTDSIEKTMIGEKPALSVEYFGPDDQSSRQGLFGIITATPTRAWFLKLKGDAELLERERSNFRKLVQSLPLQ